jgi:hypothetical protein
MAEAAPWHRRPWVGRAGLALGLVLIVAAVAAVWARREAVTAAGDAIAAPAPGPLLLLGAAILANFGLTGLLFHVLMARHGRVSRWEMQGLIAATALVNYLPLRPGLLGRVAYHQAVNRIGPRASAAVIVQALVLSAAVALYLAAALAGAAGGAPMAILLAAPLVALPAAAAWPAARPWALAGLLRYLDVGAWAVRYHAAFALLGAGIGARAAVILACVGVIATLVPFVSNGLGLREWAVGLAAPLVAAGELELGLSAELLNRGAEILVTAPLGLLALAWLARRTRAARRAAAAPADAGGR